MNERHLVVRRVFTLSGEEQRVLETGRFLRVDFGRSIAVTGETCAESVLLGRRGGQLRAFANVCRHQAIPLDARAADEEDDVMTEDGRHLLCHAHGAIYRPSDGMCISGPCAGLALFAVPVEEVAEGIALTLGK